MLSSSQDIPSTETVFLDVTVSLPKTSVRCRSLLPLGVIEWGDRLSEAKQLTQDHRGSKWNWEASSLCDSTGYLTCACQQGNHMVAGGFESFKNTIPYLVSRK